MSCQVQEPRPLKFILTILGLTAVAVATTIAVGYLVTDPPRGFMLWVGVGFLCTVEFLVGLLTVNIFVRSRCDYRPSGAILAISYGIIGAFAVSGLIGIFVYSIVRDNSGSNDGVFSAVMIVIAVVWFIIAVLLYAFDIHSQSVISQANKKGREHEAIALSLAPLLHALRSFRTADNGLRGRACSALKKVEAIHVALAHSHGGGLGSWEGVRQHPLPSNEVEDMKEGIVAMAGLAARLSGESESDAGEALGELERCIKKASCCLDLIERGREG